MMDTMTGTACPRCDRWPVEVQTIGVREPRHLPACACYPKPPACPICRTSIFAERCASLKCVHYGELVPDPITDPLWPKVNEGP